MNQKQHTLLGISPGTRLTGLVLMRAGELLEWRIKTFKGYWSPMKLKNILYLLTRYVEEYGVTSIALKKPDPLRSSVRLDQLISELTIWAKMNRIKVQFYTLHEMKKYFSSDKKFSKTQMIRQISLKYPELYTEYNKEQRNKKTYYLKMFEAIIVAKLYDQRK